MFVLPLLLFVQRQQRALLQGWEEGTAGEARLVCQGRYW